MRLRSLVIAAAIVSLPALASADEPAAKTVDELPTKEAAPAPEPVDLDITLSVGMTPADFFDSVSAMAKKQGATAPSEKELARHFSSVDADGDEVIAKAELEEHGPRLIVKTFKRLQLGAN